MKTIRKLLIVFLVQYVSAARPNDVQNINQKISDYKAIADTLPTANAANITTALSKMEVIAKDLLQSIDNLILPIYISATVQDVSTEINKQNTIFQAAFKTVIWAAVRAMKVSTSLKWQQIDVVKNSLRELSSATSAYSYTLATKVINDTNISAKPNNDYVANVKLLADTIQKLNSIDSTNIPDMLINLVQQTISRITAGIQVEIGSDDELPVIYIRAANVFKSISNGFSEALDRLPDSFKNLSVNVIKAADVLSSNAIGMLKEMVATLDAKKPLLMGNDSIPAALKTYAALRDMAKTIAAINDAAAGQLTAEIVIVLINLLKIFSYEFTATVEIFQMMSYLIDKDNNAMIKVLTPLYAEKKQLVNSAVNTLKVSGSTNLNAVYDETKALMNNFIKRSDADIDKIKIQFK